MSARLRESVLLEMRLARRVAMDWPSVYSSEIEGRWNIYETNASKHYKSVHSVQCSDKPAYRALTKRRIFLSRARHKIS